MADMSLHVSLTGDQVEYLAKVGYYMQFMTDSDKTGVDLASHLLSLLKANISSTYAGMPVLAIVTGASGNNTLDAPGAESILSLFQYLPSASSPGFAALWLFFAALSFTMLTLRFYIRHFLSGGLKKDDFVILVAWILGATYTISDAALIFTNHTDRHSWQVRGLDIRLHWKAETIGLTLFFVASALYKTALIIFYMELSPSKIYRRAGYALCGIVWIHCLVGMTWTNLWCQPYGYWSSSAATLKSYCEPYNMANAYMTSLFVWDLLLDLAVLVLPMTVVHGLQLRLKDKILVHALMCLGSAVCICAAGRISMVSGFLKSNDQTRKSLHICSWTLIEVHLGIACATAPMLRRCFVEVFPMLSAASSKLSRSGKSSKATMSAASRASSGHRKPKGFNAFSNALRSGSPSDSTTEMTAVSDREDVDGRTGGITTTVGSSHDGREKNHVKEGPMVTTTVTVTEEVV